MTRISADDLTPRAILTPWPTRSAPQTDAPALKPFSGTLMEWNLQGADQTRPANPLTASSAAPPRLTKPSAGTLQRSRPHRPLRNPRRPIPQHKSRRVRGCRPRLRRAPVQRLLRPERSRADLQRDRDWASADAAPIRSSGDRTRLVRRRAHHGYRGDAHLHGERPPHLVNRLRPLLLLVVDPSTQKILCPCDALLAVP
jgi:hypothetical protein